MSCLWILLSSVSSVELIADRLHSEHATTAGNVDHASMKMQHILCQVSTAAMTACYGVAALMGGVDCAAR